MELPQIPKSKILGFIFLGILLYLGSLYLNILKVGIADIGVGFGLLLIGLGMVAQIINWRIYFSNKIKR